MNLADLSFPVFPLRKGEAPKTENGVIFYEDEYQLDDDPTFHTYEIVDDTNMKGSTLAARRLELLRLGSHMYMLKRAVFMLGDLIKLAKPSQWFIDSNGKLFQYTKSKRYTLVFKRIIKVIPIQSGGAILEIEGTSARFKVLFAPTPQMKYAGLLRVGRGYILYGLYDQQFDSTNRKI